MRATAPVSSLATRPRPRIHAIDPSLLEDPGVEDELVGLLEGARDGGGDVVTVVGVHPVEEALVVRREIRAGLEPVDPVQLVGPRDDIADDVPLPAADLGDVLGLGQLRLAALQGVDQTPLLAVLGDPVQPADVVAVVVLDGVVADQRPEPLAVLAQQAALQVAAGLAGGLEPTEVVGELGLPGLVQGLEDGQPLHLRGRAAQHLCHPRVGEHRVALGIEHPQAVRGGLDQPSAEVAEVRCVADGTDVASLWILHPVIFLHQVRGSPLKHSFQPATCGPVESERRGLEEDTIAPLRPDRPSAIEKPQVSIAADLRLSGGGQGRGRTADLPIFSRTLVPTELPGRVPHARGGEHAFAAVSCRSPGDRRDCRIIADPCCPLTTVGHRGMAARASKLPWA